MVEYGNGVSQVSGKVAGGSGVGTPQSTDVGASLSQFMTNSVHTISTMPPAYLLIGIVVLFLGLMVVRRAF